MPRTPEEQDALRKRCRTVVAGAPDADPGAELIRVGEWCRDHGWQADRYGDGALIGAFETKVATLLGKDAGVFMPSGTMAQQIALRIWSRAGRRCRSSRCTRRRTWNCTSFAATRGCIASTP